MSRGPDAAAAARPRPGRTPGPGPCAPRTCRWSRRGPGSPRSGATWRRAPAAMTGGRRRGGCRSISASRPARSGSSTGANASTRRSRLRSIRSAEPMSHSGSPPLVKPPDPRVLEELADDRADADVLGEPGTPGRACRRRGRSGRPRRRPARPGTAPRCRRRSTSAFIFRTIPAGRPAAAWRDLAVDELEEPAAQPVRARRGAGGTSRWRDSPVRMLNRSVTSAPMSGRGT